MPYIKDLKLRERLDSVVYSFLGVIPFPEGKFAMRGNLNYFLFSMAKKSCANYAEYADFLSELTEAGEEIRRRLLAPYEDRKIKENGDVD